MQLLLNGKGFYGAHLPTKPATTEVREFKVKRREENAINQNHIKLLPM